MVRYYFDAHDGDLVRDEIGIDCENLDQVLIEATAGLADFARDVIPNAKSLELAIQVRDEQGRPVMQAILRLQIDLPKQDR
jgi:hypothetical protein